MQVYIDRCKDYYVGKQKTNEMNGINHESKIFIGPPKWHQLFYTKSTLLQQ